MKTNFKINHIVFITLMLFSTTLFSQNNATVDVKYRMKPDRSVAKENLNFSFNISNGNLIVLDYDFNSRKEYLIKFDKTFYEMRDYLMLFTQLTL